MKQRLTQILSAIAVALFFSASWAGTTLTAVAPDLQQLMQSGDSELRVIVSYRQSVGDDELDALRSRGGRSVQRLNAARRRTTRGISARGRQRS